jgi:hypothetical protein
MRRLTLRGFTLRGLPLRCLREIELLFEVAAAFVALFGRRCPSLQHHIDLVLAGHCALRSLIT